MIKIILVIPIILLFLFLKFCFIIIKKTWIEKKTVSSSDQFIAQSILKQFQNSEKKSAIEYVVYMDEEETKEYNNEKIKKNKRG